jgi:hypothetical protein
VRSRLALLVLVALAFLAGCSPRRMLVPRLSPETTVFVQGPVDTVSYRVHLYWFGSDPDGYVVAYELRFINPIQPADTQWVRTTSTDSVFAVYTPTGLSQPVFEVRAVDNEGMADPTPARQTFKFSNQAPTLAIGSGPGPNDTTFASVTVSWVATDPDGDIGNATYRVWLDGHDTDPDITTATTYTVPTDRFLQGGALLSGPRTLSVQAIDEAGYATVPQSLQWYVRAPVTGSRARLLIIDDSPGTSPPQVRQDSLFVNTADRNLPVGTFSILKLESSQPFRSAMDLEQTLKLFEAVIWYRGAESTSQPILTNYRDGLAHYLESGGRFFIESQQLVAGEGAPGILPESWVQRYFGSDFLYRHGASTPLDSVVSWGIAISDDNGNPVILRSSVFSDSLGMTLGGYGGLRGFAVTDTQYVALWARAGNLTEGNTFDVPIGVTVPQPGGGRLVAITVPIRSANSFGSVPRFLAKIFAQLGLTGP